MKYELSERVRTVAPATEICFLLERQLKMVSANTSVDGNVVTASNIQATFGSIQRKSLVRAYIKPTDDGYLMIADVAYHPSLYFWIFIIGSAFFYVLPVIFPVGFYLYHQNLVKNTVHEVLRRVESEARQSVSASQSGLSIADELTKLAKLRSDGALTLDEFEQRKRLLLR